MDTLSLRSTMNSWQSNVTTAPFVCYVEDAGDPVFTVAPAYEVLWGAGGNCSVVCALLIGNPCCMCAIVLWCLSDGFLHINFNMFS